jgi:hypothetical protein
MYIPGIKKPNVKLYEYFDISNHPKDMRAYFFPIFCIVHVYLRLQIDHFRTVLRNLGRLEFLASCLASETKAFLFHYEMTYLE